MRRLIRWLARADIDRAWEDGVLFARNQMRDDGWWFSADPPTMKMIQSLATQDRRIDEIRSDWERETGRQAGPQRILKDSRP